MEEGEKTENFLTKIFCTCPPLPRSLSDLGCVPQLSKLEYSTHTGSKVDGSQGIIITRFLSVKNKAILGFTAKSIIRRRTAGHEIRD